MRKYYFYILGLIFLASCSADPELAPIITIDNAEIGAFPRTVNLTSGEYDLNNLSTSSYMHDIDFRSEDGGQNVSSYRVFVAFDDNNPDNGDDSSAEQLVQDFGQSDFGDSGNGTRSLTLDFPFSEMASITGVPLENVSPGDRFQFRTELELTDGRVFTAENTESTIFGPAFRAFFDWNVNATCPLDDNLFVGTYAISHIQGPGNPWATGVREANVELALVPGSSTLRAINGLVVIDAFGGFDMAVQLDFVCDIVVWNDSGPGVGCGPPNIAYNGGTPQPIDITNDAEIIVEIEEEGGGCGYSNVDIIRLTKI
jgi:hypothetical protein